MSTVNLLAALTGVLCWALPFLALGLFVVLTRRSPAVRLGTRKIPSLPLSRRDGVFLALPAMFGLMVAANKLPLGHTGRLVLLGLTALCALGMGLLLIWLLIWPRSRASEGQPPDFGRPGAR
jgi:hypothetical protein